MKVQKRTTQLPRIIDPETQWKITLRNYDFGSYQMSASDWRTLLARAKRGDPEAEWEVADRYADGCKDQRGRIILRRSSKKAAEWFRRAAEHGNTAAQNNLGILLSGGNGVTRNRDEAFRWFKKAFRGGDSCAAQNIAITFREIGNFKSAANWFLKAADAGDGDALIQLGIHYYWGKGIRKDSKAAVRCFRSALRSKNISEAGRDDAFFLLGVASYEGKGVRSSIPNAKKLFERANIDKDHPPAQEFLQQLRVVTSDTPTPS